MKIKATRENYHEKQFVPTISFIASATLCAALVVSAVWQRTSDRAGGAARGGGCRLEVSSLLRVR